MFKEYYVMCKRNNLFNRFSGLQTELKALNQSDTNICVGINIWINSFTFIRNTTLRQRQSVHFSGLHKQEEELGDVPSFTPAATWIKGNIVKRFSKCCLLKYLKATLQITQPALWKVCIVSCDSQKANDAGGNFHIYFSFLITSARR